MSKRGRQVTFHGAFTTQRAAAAKHKRVARSYVRRVRMRGRTRYLVLTRRRSR